MFNKYYRINESRWALPDEDGIIYSNYEDGIKNDRLKNDEGWDKGIKEELERFYNENKNCIVTEYDNLKNFVYYYITFSYLTLEEKNKLKRFDKKWEYDEKEDRTYEVREVIRKHPELNPSYILFKFFRNDYPIEKLSKNLSCAIKEYYFKYDNDKGLYLYEICPKKVIYKGEYYFMNVK